MDFKINQSVTLTDLGLEIFKHSQSSVPYSGIITKIYPITDYLPYLVAWDNGESYWMREDEIQLAHSPVAREQETRTTTLPISSEERKECPIYSGPFKYFPKALVEVARVCKVGNDKHRKGKPLGHSRGKSGDHADCILRHMIDMSEDYGKGKGYDENGVPQVAYIAWRALALAQEWFEANQGSPLAPGAVLDD